MTKLPKEAEVVSQPQRGSYTVDEEFIIAVDKKLTNAQKRFNKEKILSPPVLVLPEEWIRENLAGGSQMAVPGLVETLNRKLEKMDTDLRFARRTHNGIQQIYVTKKREE